MRSLLSPKPKKVMPKSFDGSITFVKSGLCSKGELDHVTLVMGLLLVFLLVATLTATTKRF